MYYQVEQVLEQQEPEIEKFYKGRGLLICEAKQGLFALKEYFGLRTEGGVFILAGNLSGAAGNPV